MALQAPLWVGAGAGARGYLITEFQRSEASHAGSVPSPCRARLKLSRSLTLTLRTGVLGLTHHLPLSSALLPGRRTCPLFAGHMQGEETQGRGRCQQAPVTISSWPRDLGAQTLSSNQGTDSISQKCHDLKPNGRRKQEKKGILQAKPQKSPLTSCGARLRDKQGAVEQREGSSRSGTGRAFSSSQSPSLLWFSPPSSVSRRNT